MDTKFQNTKMWRDENTRARAAFAAREARRLGKQVEDGKEAKGVIGGQLACMAKIEANELKIKQLNCSH